MNTDTERDDIHEEFVRIFRPRSEGPKSTPRRQAPEEKDREPTAEELRKLFR